MVQVTGRFDPSPTLRAGEPGAARGPGLTRAHTPARRVTSGERVRAEYLPVPPTRLTDATTIMTPLMRLRHSGSRVPTGATR